MEEKLNNNNDDERKSRLPVTYRVKKSITGEKEECNKSILDRKIRMFINISRDLTLR